jgi:hypothetical protein
VCDQCAVDFQSTASHLTVLSPMYEWSRPLGSNPICTATYTSQTRDEVPDGAFFLFVSKWFSGAIRLSETGISAEIGL